MKLNERLKWAYNIKVNWVGTIFRVLLGMSLLYAGFGHLTFARLEFVAQVPSWVPLPIDLVVILSGITEIIIGLALIALPKWKALIGFVAALFFILIFPGNISQYINQVDAFGLDSDKARFIRLLFQPLLVVWALGATGAYKAYLKLKHIK